MRLVVVGRQDRFRNWLGTLPTDEQRWIKPVHRFADMFGVHSAVVEFMPDWRENGSRSAGENARILWEAETMEQRRAALAKRQEQQQ